MKAARWTASSRYFSWRTVQRAKNREWHDRAFRVARDEASNHDEQGQVSCPRLGREPLESRRPDSSRAPLYACRRISTARSLVARNCQYIFHHTYPLAAISKRQKSAKYAKTNSQNWKLHHQAD